MLEIMARPFRFALELYHGTQVRGVARIRKNNPFELIPCESGTHGRPDAYDPATRQINEFGLVPRSEA